MAIRILIVEDEASILMGIEDELIGEGYEVSTSSDGEDGFNKALNDRFDLILLDIMLPGMDGLTICRELRKRNIDTPIIMLTAKSQEIDKVLGLELGADDYVTKPFSLRELQARINAVLRRSHSTDTGDKIQLGPLFLDRSRSEASLDGEPLEITYLEFTLLFYLASNPSKVLDREKILEAVWQDDVLVGSRTVDTHITNLRKKLDREGQDKSWIQGIRGIGYKFILPRFNKT